MASCEIACDRVPPWPPTQIKEEWCVVQTKTPGLTGPALSWKSQAQTLGEVILLSST